MTTFLVIRKPGQEPTIITTLDSSPLHRVILPSLSLFPTLMRANQSLETKQSALTVLKGTSINKRYIDFEKKGVVVNTAAARCWSHPMVPPIYWFDS